MFSKFIMSLAILTASTITFASSTESLKIRVNNRGSNSKWVMKLTGEKHSTTALLAANSKVDDTISGLSLDTVYECDAVVGQVTGVPGAGEVQQIYSLENCK